MSKSLMVELEEVGCHYDGTRVVNGLSLRVRRGQVVCLLGPSGCGKTTVLRAVAGFHPLSGGRICLRGQAVSEPGRTVPPEQRRLGMVFQDYALFPHLNVLDNITFGLRKHTREQRRQTGCELLDMVGLKPIATRFPHELSGGQQQRVALARALAGKPDLVLLDEPFSSLDGDLRDRLGQEVKAILQQQDITAVMVTHDQHEAFGIGDLVGVMDQGRLLQWDTPFNLYHDPAERFVADFIGQGRFIEATLQTPDTLRTEFGVIQADRAFLWPPGTRVDLLLRPDDIVHDDTASLRGRVTNKAFKGAETLYTLAMKDGTELLSLVPSHLDFRVGDDVGLRIAADHVVAFSQQ
jgi:iron(III) transport system ATP-binding protein